MIRHLDSRTSVSGQLQPDAIASLAAAGVTLIINNRQDGEEPGQPGALELRQAADDAGVAFLEVPIQGRPDNAVIDSLARTLAGGDARIHLFCRSGTRSAAAWALVQIRGGQPVDAVLSAARAAGYDLAGLFV